MQTKPEHPCLRLLNKVHVNFENWGTNPEIKPKNTRLYWSKRYKNGKFFLNPWYLACIWLPWAANSICLSKRRLWKQGKNAAIVLSYQHLAACGLYSSCTKTVPAGLTTFAKLSFNHFLNHLNFWDQCNYKLQERIFFCFTLNKLSSLQDLQVCMTRNYNQLFSLHVYATYNLTNFIYVHLPHFFPPPGNNRHSLLDLFWKTSHTFNNHWLPVHHF